MVIVGVLTGAIGVIIWVLTIGATTSAVLTTGAKTNGLLITGATTSGLLTIGAKAI